MKKFMLLPLVCLLAITSAENEFETEFSDILTLDEFDKNNIFSPEVLRELAEELEKTYGSSTRISIQPYGKPIVAVVNVYVDKLLMNLNNFITSSRGLNSLDIPGISKKLEYRPPLSLITFTGLLNLTDGKLSGLATIVRKGNVTITYGDKQLRLLVPVGISSLSLQCNYVAQIMKLGARGGITGKVAETTFTFGLAYNMTGHRVSLHGFTINKIGSIKLKFSGHILTDWLASLVTNIVLPFFKHIIQIVVNKKIYGILESVIDLINMALEKAFP